MATVDARVHVSRTVPATQGDPARPLRVALMVDEFPVISETFVINQAAGLVARGHDVTILAMVGRLPDDPVMHGSVAQYKLAARVVEPVGRRLLIGRLRRAAAPGSDRLPPAWSLFQRGSAFVAQAMMLAGQRPFDVLHCQFGTLGLAALRHLTTGTLRTRRLLVHLRGSDVSRFVQERGRDVYRPLIPHVDMFVANCEHFRNRAIELGAAPERVTVIGSAIDLDRFPLKEDHAREPGPVRIVSIGRLTEKKGFEYAIRAVARLAAEGRAVRYEIIGEGVLRPALEALVSDLGLDGKVRLAGRMEHGAIAERLRASDLLVAPSVRAASGDEDAPVNALKEGMAVGLPVVATLHGGIPELVEEGISGHLVPERDADAIAVALARLIDAPERWRALGLSGRQRVVAEYSQPVIVNQTIELYRSLLGRRERRE